MSCEVTLFLCFLKEFVKNWHYSFFKCLVKFSKAIWPLWEGLVSFSICLPVTGLFRIFFLSQFSNLGLSKNMSISSTFKNLLTELLIVSLYNSFNFCKIGIVCPLLFWILKFVSFFLLDQSSSK